MFGGHGDIERMRLGHFTAADQIVAFWPERELVDLAIQTGELDRCGNISGGNWLAVTIGVEPVMRGGVGFVDGDLQSEVTVAE